MHKLANVKKYDNEYSMCNETDVFLRFIANVYFYITLIYYTKN